ncbi:MAG: hypothetical protein PF689_09865, partial [Deltaproteobacteria bacterium]|nr:hypothetical protein [Deltaproteobacteria bacterium]
MMKSSYFIKMFLLLFLTVSCAGRIRSDVSYIQSMYNELRVYGKIELNCKKDKIMILTNKKLLASKLFDVYGCGKVVRIEVRDCSKSGGYTSGLNYNSSAGQGFACQIRKIDSLSRGQINYFWSGQKQEDDKAVSFTRTIKYKQYTQQLNQLLTLSKEKNEFKTVRLYNSDIVFDDLYKLTNKTSILNGYRTKPDGLVKIDENGIIKIWYKDLLSYAKYVRKNATRSFEPEKETMEKIATYPKGGTIFVQVLRKTSDEAIMNKFIFVLKEGNKTIKRVYLNDKNPQKKNISLTEGDMDFYVNGEVVPVKNMIDKKISIY